MAQTCFRLGVDHPLSPPFSATSFLSYPSLTPPRNTLAVCLPSILLTTPVRLFYERENWVRYGPFFFSDYILRWVFLWVGCGFSDEQKLLLFVTTPTPGPRGNPRKCEFHTAILGTTVFFSRNAYSPRLRRSISPSQKRVFTIARPHLAPCYVLPPTLLFLQHPGTCTTGVLP